ncbi:MAG: hypothetical protein OXC65_14565 [Thiotrichales bacterium]|nr:hypothetical protein [Thiotrichales bacterium]
MTDYRRLRTQAGLADLQAWTRFELVGPQACDALDAVVGGNVRDLFEGRAANTLIPSSSGGIEAIVWVIALPENGYRIVGEPEDGEAVGRALAQSVAGRDAAIRDIRDETFALALIGPEAEKVAWKAFGDEVHSIAFLNVMPVGDPAVLAARIGYFGEYELHLFGEIERKQSIVDTLGKAADGDPLVVGDGALPTMMTEMGTLSRARDVPPDVSVFEAGLQWMIDFRKENLRSAEALEHEKRAVHRKCVLMVVDGNASDLRRQSVFIEDHELGRIQSAFDSETLGRSVALAYLTEELAIPGLTCVVGPARRRGETVSAPAFLGRSILENLG